MSNSHNEFIYIEKMLDALEKKIVSVALELQIQFRSHQKSLPFNTIYVNIENKKLSYIEWKETKEIFPAEQKIKIEHLRSKILKENYL